MSSPPPSRIALPCPAPLCPAPLCAHAFRSSGLLRIALTLAALLSLAPPAHPQVSLAAAVDLALRSSPRVKGAQDDVNKAGAQLSESHYAYIPSLTIGAALGQAYGYSPYPPTLATISSSSLVYNAGQHDYIHSARAGLEAAELALQDVSQTVAQDTALAFLALNHDQQRALAIRQESEYATNLVTIVEERLDAGQDTEIDLTRARLTAAQLHVAILKAEDDSDADCEHLARLTGLPATSLSTYDSFPADPVFSTAPEGVVSGDYATPGVASMFANARARQQQAAGDAKFRYWPQINMVAQYNRYATFTNSFTQLKEQQAQLTANDTAFGVQISIPLFDEVRSAKARESADEASRAFHDAQAVQTDALDGQTRLRHTVVELQAQAEVAALQQQLAQQQLDVLHLQMQSGTGNPNAPQMTPKDEQNARIAERDKYLSVIDAGFQLRQAEIQLLRQRGELLNWLKSAAAAAPTGSPHSSQPGSQPHSTTLPVAPGPRP